MTLQEVIESYTSLIEKESIDLGHKKKLIFRVGSLRLVVVLVCITLCYLLWGTTSIVVGTLLISFIIFLVLLKWHNRLHIAKRYSELTIINANNELKGINHNFSAFDGASDKNDANHSFSYDLDMFGNKSFFQSINRTVTQYGSDKLANTILYPSNNKVDILSQQQAVKELNNTPSLLNHFRATGQMSETDEMDIKTLASQFVNVSLNKPFCTSLWRFTPYIMPCVAAITIISYALDIIPFAIFITLWSILILVSCIPLKRLKYSMTLWDKSKDHLQTYSQLLEIVEQQAPSNPIFAKISQQLKGNNTASVAISQLGRHIDNFNQTFTLPGILLLCPILMWNVKYGIKIEQWAMRHQDDINKWFDALAQFDSLVSLAIFSYNHPDYVYPTIADQFTFEAKDLGHPMLRREVCVRNDVHINQHPFFLVVTGANMAGKSTYLRTVGINLVMATIGLPVCASSFHFYPFTLVTNLRTSDSLADSESYFFAELKRLKMIIDRLQTGEELFIILDEILKGTNSEDKQKGSIALMKQLIALSGCGIIATHDLLLGNLESEFPNAVKNYRFEADIANEQLSFSYKIREGVAQNMNACFLMKRMGITGL